MFKKSLFSFFLVLTLLTLAFMPAPAFAANDWPQFHNDAANTGYSASSAPDTADLAWVSENVNANNSSSVVVAEGKVFVYSCISDEEFVTIASAVYCLNEAGGETLWQREVDKAEWGSWSSPAYHDGKVFISSGKKTYCLNAQSGAILWTFVNPTNQASCNGGPAVAGGMVFCSDWDGRHYYALNENTGQELWRFQVAGYAQGTPAYADGKVYLTSWEFYANKNSHIYCLNAENGSLVWHQDGNGDQSTCGSPTVAGGKVFVTTYNFYGYGKVAALDAGNGSPVWATTVQRTDSTPAYANGRLYLCGGCVNYSEQQTYCVDAATGGIIWQTPVELGLGNWTCSVAVADGKVFVGKPSDSFFDYAGTYALNAATGNVVWSYDQGGSSPAVANGRVYTLGGGKVYAFGQLEQEYPAWDVNKDGQVNVLDMSCVGQKFGQTGSPGWIREDVNKDGQINVLDMSLIGQHWMG